MRSSFPAALLSNTTAYPDDTFTGPPDDVDGRNLPAGCEIIFDFGNNPITAGGYLNVYELDWGGPEFSSIRVEVSTDNSNYTVVTATEGPALSIPGDEQHGNSSFARPYRVADADMRYVRITTLADGFDLDAVGTFVGASFPATLSSNNTTIDDDVFTGRPDDVDGRNLPAGSEIVFDFGSNRIPPTGYFNVYELDLWGPPEFDFIKVEVSATARISPRLLRLRGRR